MAVIGLLFILTGSFVIGFFIGVVLKVCAVVFVKLMFHKR